MKQIIVLAIISLSLCACTSSANKKEKANLAIAQKYMKAVETMDVALMDSLLLIIISVMALQWEIPQIRNRHY